MEMFEKLKGMQKDKKMLAAVTVLGMAFADNDIIVSSR